mmetsp:Transcript_21/g.39  ORF Transcript_21/g.39 Transcript_21/m.39 type:complete len:1400 (+) Transcript_21:55-4254(+)
MVTKLGSLGSSFSRMNEDDMERDSTLMNLDEEIGKESLAGYTPDCGRRREYNKDGKKVEGTKFLSYKKARSVIAQRHVGKLVDTTNDGARDTLVPFPLNAPTGAHNFSENGLCYRAFKKCFGTCMRQKPSVLEPYGIGLVLYFKFLKFMTVIFLLMSLALAPSMYFYWVGSSMTKEDQALMIEESFLNALFFTTIGSLGAGASTCMEGDVSEMFDLKCPSGVFKKIEAHWGQPNGYCSCPASQQTNDQGTCPGQITYPSDGVDGGTCSGGACFLSTTKLKESCCAKTRFDPMNGDFTPDLTNVDISTNPTCHSPSAQFIAEGMCLGRQNCTFPVSVNHTYTWTYDPVLRPYKCDEDWDPAVEDHTCSRNLMHENYLNYANFSSCPRDTHQDDYQLIVIGLCAEEDFDFEFNGEEYTYSKKDIIKILSYTDSGCAFLFLMAIYWMAKREEEATDESDSLNCSPSDYAVIVSNLPNHQSLDSLKLCLKTHFEKTLKENKNEEDEKLREKGLSAKIVDHEDLGIFDIQFSLNNRKQIYWKTVRGRVARIKDKMENEVVFLKKIGKFKGKRKAKLMIRHKLLENNFHKCNAKLEAIEKRIAEGAKKEYAKYAFITFNAEEGAVRCKKIYPDLGFLQRLTMKKKHMIELDGKLARPNVKTAPEPSEIIWENLGISSFMRYIRVGFTSLITVLLLAASFVVIHKARVAQETAQLKYPEADCSGYIITPDPNATHLNMTITLRDIEYLTAAQVQRDENWQHYNLTLGNTGKLECFCKGLLVDPQYSLNGMLSFPFNDEQTGDESATWCKPWFETYTYITFLKYLAVGGVCGTNVVLKLVLKKLINIEGPKDKTSLILSLTLKIFAASLINTAFLTLLINGNIELFLGDTGDDNSAVAEYGVLGGGYSDFSEEWYLNIGVPIVITMIINLVSPHIETFVLWATKRWAQYADRSCTPLPAKFTKKVTQNDLENLYTGPEFIMYLRYAQLLNTLFVTLIFSSGMPVLIPICFLTFLSYYFFDKWMLLRFFSLPPRLDASLARRVSSLLPFSVVLHLMFGMWMMSNEEFFKPEAINLDTSTNSTAASVVPVDVSVSDLSTTFGDNAFMGEVYDRFTHTNNLASLILLVLLITGLLWFRLVAKILKSSQGLLACVPFLARFLAHESELEGNPPFIEAIETEILNLQIGLELIDEDILEKYKAEISRRAQPGYRAPERSINILESYDFEANQEYIQAFASDATSIMNYNKQRRSERRSASQSGGGGGDDGEGAQGPVRKQSEAEREKLRMEHMSRMHRSGSAGAAGRGKSVEMSGAAAKKKPRGAGGKAPSSPGGGGAAPVPAPVPPPGQGSASAPSPPPPPVVDGGALVPSWIQRYDAASGHHYYENESTGNVTWEEPETYRPLEVNAAQL